MKKRSPGGGYTPLIIQRSDHERMNADIAMKLTMQLFRESQDPSHPLHDPRVYPDEIEDPVLIETQTQQITPSIPNETIKVYDPETSEPGEEDDEECFYEHSFKGCF